MINSFSIPVPTIVDIKDAFKQKQFKKVSAMILLKFLANVVFLIYGVVWIVKKVLKIKVLARLI